MGHGPLPSLMPAMVLLSLSHDALPLALTLLPQSFLFKDVCDHVGPAWIIQSNLLKSAD